MHQLRTTAMIGGKENGCDWWRVVEPFLDARHLGHDCNVGIFGQQIVYPPDILVFRGLFMEPESFDKFLDQCERDQVLVVLDYDDLFDSGAPDEIIRYQNPRFKGDVPTAARHMIQNAHLVTTTTMVLADEAAARSGRDRDDIIVVPNAINLDSWKYLPPPNPNKPLLVVAGGDSHRKDWGDVPDVFTRLADLVPTLRFRVCGDDPSWLSDLKRELGDRLEYKPFVKFSEYPYSFAGATVVWAPLANTVFNACRSPIRHWEATAAGAAFIGATRPYNQSVTDGETGYLTDRPDDVVGLVGHLLTAEPERAKMVSLARQVLLEHRLCQDAVDERFYWYYSQWHWRYNYGAVASGGVSEVNSSRALRDGASEQPGSDRPYDARYRPDLPRDAAGSSPAVRTKPPVIDHRPGERAGREQPGMGQLWTPARTLN